MLISEPIKWEEIFKMKTTINAKAIEFKQVHGPGKGWIVKTTTSHSAHGHEFKMREIKFIVIKKLLNPTR